MPHFKTAFPSKFLSAAEIEKPYDCTIDKVDYDNVGTEDKPERKLVATFKEEGCKPIVMNISRCEAVADLAKTPDYLKWSGIRVGVSQGTTRYAGKRVPCIVLGPPTKRPKGKASTVNASAEPEPPDALPDLDDEDPF